MHPSHGHDQTIVNGISRIGYMTGGKAALWKDEDMADVFTGKAVEFIEAHKAAPFFLFFATHDPRVIGYADRVVILQDGVITKDSKSNGKS